MISSYDEYTASLELMEETSINRWAGKEEKPNNWGDKLNEDEYFCDNCWYAGFETGAHPYRVPPCDPPTRPTPMRP
jgi:hypothetical protein